MREALLLRLVSRFTQIKVWLKVTFLKIQSNWNKIWGYLSRIFVSRLTHSLHACLSGTVGIVFTEEGKAPSMSMVKSQARRNLPFIPSCSLFVREHYWGPPGWLDCSCPLAVCETVWPKSWTGRGARSECVHEGQAVAAQWQLEGSGDIPCTRLQFHSLLSLLHCSKIGDLQSCLQESQNALGCKS